MFVELMALHLSKVIAVIVQISLRPAQVPKPAKVKQPRSEKTFVNPYFVGVTYQFLCQAIIFKNKSSSPKIYIEKILATNII